MKKFIYAGLSSIVLATTLAGCGGTSNGGSNGKVVELKKGDKVEIEFWYGLGGKLGDQMKEKIDAFNKSQDKVVVKGVQQADYDETYKKLQAAVASGKTPALILTTTDTGKIMAKKKILTELTPYIDVKDDYETKDIIETFLKDGQFEDKQFTLPAYGTTQLMYYRKDALKEAGLTEDIFKDWTKFEAAAKKLTKKSGNKVERYGWSPMWGADNLMDIAFSNGGQVIDESGKKVMINSKEWVEAWSIIDRGINKDKTMKINSGGQGWEYWYKTIDEVMQGKSAGYIGSSGDQGDLDFKQLAAAEQPGFNGKKGAPVASSQQLAIPSKAEAKQKAAAFEFIKFFEKAENTADWSMNTGYIAVRSSAKEDAKFKAYAKKHPQILKPIEQAEHASSLFIDPTGGKIQDAIKKAADKMEIEGKPAKEVLDEAQKEAQAALDNSAK
ncbi:ABC transporter substrate-binding protein [Macrococcoides goetzii]|uniref:ABC transporter substrate-binding protein n=1 Tax=Macrococcus TaxID=69965 RepID=UPI001EF3D1E1|nr:MULTISPECIES: ABC transporter substrate-binding protein [Macrococcus]MCG7419610.1 ABC transporter substrate-binding protein [Macrococcus epidermidis]MCH4984430.1 ABC transporter substrate-binding protein [Macrococcus sp. PK]MCH4985169.1 ABC transporter substrate-binding protein [Macrococcus sp. PK]